MCVSDWAGAYISISYSVHVISQLDPRSILLKVVLLCHGVVRYWEYPLHQLLDPSIDTSQLCAMCVAPAGNAYDWLTCCFMALATPYITSCLKYSGYQ